MTSTHSVHNIDAGQTFSRGASSFLCVDQLVWTSTQLRSSQHLLAHSWDSKSISNN